MSTLKALISLPCPPSALSPGVRHLLCGGEAGISGSPESVKAGVLNWDHLDKILPEWVSDTSQYFHEAASRLAPVFLQCEELLCGMTSREFEQSYDHQLQWTGNSQLFLKCFQFLSQGSESDRLLALLMMSSALERALGDVFLLKGHQCPSMLKDLLVTPELQDEFGKTVIQVLRVVIGPPISLNIRNVAWHGFPAPGEIQDRLCWFLLLLVPSLGECLQQNGVDPLNIIHRSPVTVNQDQLLAGSLPALSPDDLISIEQLFISTDFVQQQFVPVWHRSLDLYREGRYGPCLVLLLPQVEHSLRRVFAAVNGCPDRVLTAEATTLYTTFDEILDKHLPSHAENGLLNVIGENSMDLLFDLLVYPDGPRVRDRLSHGEITLDILPQALADAVIHLTVHLSALFVPHEKNDLCETPHIARMQRRVSHYQSLFHPIPVAKTKVLALVALSGVMVTWIHHSPHLEPWTTDDGVDVFVRDNVRLAEVLAKIQQVAEGLNQSSLSVHFLSHDLMSCLMPFTDVGSLVRHILCSPISTVYRGQTATNQNFQASHDGQGKSEDIKESEIVGLVSRIITETHEGMSQIKVALEMRQKQFVQKQLRSRQRDNLKRLLESLPSLHVMANILCIMAACLLAHLDQLNNLKQTQMKKLQKFLKACLQYTENLRTFSGPDRNKWTECTDLTIRFLPRLVTAVNENMFLGPLSTPSRAMFQ
ncbi:endoplasmic reticulum membrane-associated RNA degradation protein-like [Haliotis asinina]|uniref:endoplasmic reticulum membrane-associated RNA degradation protein-like n=1 Tax=Haliotis asinina TaxID=109174 RepID=UPI0035319AE3